MKALTLWLDSLAPGDFYLLFAAVLVFFWALLTLIKALTHNGGWRRR